MKKLSLGVLGLGALGVLASLAWWYSAYSKLVEASRGRASLTDLAVCIYSAPAKCQFAGGMAQLAGGSSSYSPTLFWVAAAVLAIGAVLQFAVKK